MRRGGTISLSGVYGGMADPMPMMTLFDKQVQIRMGQANVKRWVPDILPLLTDDDPLGVDDFATHRLPLEAAPARTRLPGQGGRHGQGRAQARDGRNGCRRVTARPRPPRTSLWWGRRGLTPDAGAPAPDALPGAADVLVVGAGLTGLCTAVLLARAGHPPVVVDARAAGAGTTGHSTAKLSLLQGSVLQRLHEHAGADVVSAYVRANRAGQALAARGARADVT